jgi:hypothetical protein
MTEAPRTLSAPLSSESKIKILQNLIEIIQTQPAVSAQIRSTPLWPFWRGYFAGRGKYGEPTPARDSWKMPGVHKLNKCITSGPVHACITSLWYTAQSTMNDKWPNELEVYHPYDRNNNFRHGSNTVQYMGWDIRIYEISYLYITHTVTSQKYSDMWVRILD